MKKRFVLIVILAIAGTTMAGGFGFVALGRAEATPPTHIEAKFAFVDSGTTLRVFGRARGMAPNSTYASLVYDVGSVMRRRRASPPPRSRR